MHHRFRASARLSLALMSLVVLLGVLAAQATAADTVVSITFDDGRDSQLLAADALEDHGMRGTFYAISGRVDTEARSMTSAELRSLAAAGHEIGGHSRDHRDLATLDGDALRTQICDDRENFLDMGVGPISSFAYPYGSYDAEVIAMLAECGYTSGRSAGNTRTATCTTCPYADSIPPQKRYEIKMATWPGTDIPFETLRDRVLDAQAAGGGWVVYGLHDICNQCDPSTGSVTEADFRAFVQWLDDQNITVKTVNEVMDTVAPQTTLDPAFGPADGGTTGATTADFRFSADEVGATFRCQLDTGPIAACTSPQSVAVTPGTHTFRVWATDVAGNQDATPATRTWTVTAPPAVVGPTDDGVQQGGETPAPGPGADTTNTAPASISGRRTVKRRADSKGRFTLGGAKVRCSSACAVKVTTRLGRRVLARTAFTLTKGERGIRLRLGKKGRALLERRSLKLRVSVAVEAAGEPRPVRATFTVLLRRR